MRVRRFDVIQNFPETIGPSFKSEWRAVHAGHLNPRIPFSQNLTCQIGRLWLPAEEEYPQTIRSSPPTQLLNEVYTRNPWYLRITQCIAGPHNWHSVSTQVLGQSQTLAKAARPFCEDVELCVHRHHLASCSTRQSMRDHLVDHIVLRIAINTNRSDADA